MTNCQNCNNLIDEDYCSNCGHPAKLHRIDKHYISHEVLHLLHFEKGFFYTVKQLFIRPGETIKEYIETNRNKHIKPLAFLIVTSLLFTLIEHLVHADEIFSQPETAAYSNSSINDILNWVKTHWGYTNLLIGIFTAMCLKLFFRKFNYNIFEIIVLLCFVMGQAMLLLAVITLFVNVLGKQAYIIISSVISYGYSIWAIGQFFDSSKVSSYVKAFLGYFSGYLLFYIAIIPVGLVADLVIRLFKDH